jgi:ATP-dependent RNA helicase RhlE
MRAPLFERPLQLRQFCFAALPAGYRMQFTDLNLSAALLKAIADKGYTTPSPIQLQAIPAVLGGRDLMAAAQTGTGKTAGFTLPLLQLLTDGAKVQPNQVRALILTPTRELAAQVAESVAVYGKYLPLKSAVVFGGVKINPQMMALRRGVDILVATPGRLLDLYQQNAVRFTQLEVLVLDEADRMLDMGFINDIKKVLALLPKKRQNLLFSATFSDDIRKLAKGLVNDPLEVSVSPANTTAERVEQVIYPVDKNRKAALVTKLINDNKWQQVLIFTKTKHMANKLSLHLENAGIKAAPIHGNKSQNARTKALADFKAGAVRALVATDIAARGLDIDQLPQVVNFELPNVAEDYVHRIGRTGRAGAAGHAVSLVCADETKELAGIERLIKQTLTRQVLAGFEPVNVLPESKLNTKPYKPKKPKMARPEHRDGQRPSQQRSAAKPSR